MDRWTDGPMDRWTNLFSRPRPLPSSQRAPPRCALRPASGLRRAAPSSSPRRARPPIGFPPSAFSTTGGPHFFVVSRWGARPSGGPKFFRFLGSRYFYLFTDLPLFGLIRRMSTTDRNNIGRRIGEGHPRAKYAEATIRGILALAEQGITLKAIAETLDMPYPTVRSIVSGRTRQQTPDPER